MNLLLKVHFIKIRSEEPAGYIGKCFAEYFADVPPYRSYAVIEAPTEAYLYVHWRNWEFIYESALQRPERMEWLSRWYGDANATQYMDWVRERLAEARRKAEELRAGLGA
ncbi:MAG: hypothetical protein QXT13_07345 [Pyrobaculum sp.]